MVRSDIDYTITICDQDVKFNVEYEYNKADESIDIRKITRGTEEVPKWLLDIITQDDDLDSAIIEKEESEADDE